MKKFHLISHQPSQPLTPFLVGIFTTTRRFVKFSFDHILIGITGHWGAEEGGNDYFDLETAEWYQLRKAFVVLE